MRSSDCLISIQGFVSVASSGMLLSHSVVIVSVSDAARPWKTDFEAVVLVTLAGPALVSSDIG